MRATGVGSGPLLRFTALGHYQLSDNPVHLAQRERLYEGLRLAGAPES
jgi:hypothetical protein